MRAFFSISLLCLILLPSGSGYLFFKTRQYQIRRQIRHQIRKGLPESELTLLKIPKTLEENPGTEFKRFHAGEFRYRGKMYDIVRKEVYPDTTYYWCVEDVQETRLMQVYEDLIRNTIAADSASKQHQEKNIRFCKSLFFEIRASGIGNFSGKNLPGFVSNTAQLLYRTIQPESPPPEIHTWSI